MKPSRLLRTVGPGLAVAATGVGAGDLMAALLAGAEFGHSVLWFIVLGAILKFALNEGIARWQLATGTTVLEGWSSHLGRTLRGAFLLYLLLWSYIVAAGLMSACGVAAHALSGTGTVAGWSIVHSLAALVLVVFGRYALFETVMKVFIAVMVVTLLSSVIMIGIDMRSALTGLVVPRIPAGAGDTALSVIGGVGGSVTLLSYGYWIREKGWNGAIRLRDVRWDLGVGYFLTGLFGVAMLLLAADVLADRAAELPRGSVALALCADAVRDANTARLGPGFGAIGRLVFLIGIWGAVFTSTLGVWQGVPYLFADYVRVLRGRSSATVDSRGWDYRSYLLYLALPPMILLVADRPLWVIKTYTVFSGLFMPFLGASLLWMNGRDRWVGRLRNGVVASAGLMIALALFAAVMIRQLVDL